MLSDYFEGIKWTWVDTPVYIYDSGNPGGSLLWLGGTHPYEPGAILPAYVAAENIEISKSDWDSRENSWGFIKPRILKEGKSLALAYDKYIFEVSKWLSGEGCRNAALSFFTKTCAILIFCIHLDISHNI